MNEFNHYLQQINKIKDKTSLQYSVLQDFIQCHYCLEVLSQTSSLLFRTVLAEKTKNGNLERFVVKQKHGSRIEIGNNKNKVLRICRLTLLICASKYYSCVVFLPLCQSSVNNCSSYLHQKLKIEQNKRNPSFLRAISGNTMLFGGGHRLFSSHPLGGKPFSSLHDDSIYIVR